MSPEEWEEKLRGAVELYNAGDFEAAAKEVGAEIRLRRGPHAPEGHEDIKGADDIREFMKPRVFKEQRLELLGVEHGQARILAHFRYRALGSGSGIPVEADSWFLYELSGEEVSAIEIHQDEQAGRAAFSA